MKILHLSGSDYGGGAAIGAYRLHTAMRQRGVDSQMLVIEKLTTDDTVLQLLEILDKSQHVAAHRFDRKFNALYGIEDLPIRTFNTSGVLSSQVINDLAPDVVQLHWVGNNLLRIDDIARIEAPVVWKMADMYAFCGAEHYVNADEPQRHLEGYDVIPPFRGEVHDIDRMIWELKKAHWGDLNLTMVAPSRFLAREAHRSSLLGAYDSHVIPNPLPGRYIRSAEGESERIARYRDAFGLPQDKLVIMFSAFIGGEKRKGYHHIEAMLEQHLDRYVPRDRAVVLIVGGDEDREDVLHGYSVFFRKRMPNDQRYSNLLMASDILLFPSEMDSTAMVVQEVLAAGRPAVVFGVGGLVDLVHHEKSGFVVDPYDVEGLARGLKWWLDLDDAGRAAVRMYCRTRSRALNAPDKTVQGYLGLYEKVLRNTRRDRTVRSGALHDLEVDNSRAVDPPRRVAIVEPSCKSVFDSSHNTKFALAFSAYFRAAGFRTSILAHEDCTIPSTDDIEIRPMFDYMAYDKLRLLHDTRKDGAQTALRDHPHYSRRTYSQMSRYIAEAGLGQGDALFFPMTDRIQVDAVLRYLTAEDSVMGPSFHFNLMFDRAKFLVGEYPIDDMLRALKNSRYLGRKIFLYSETQALADLFAETAQVVVTVMKPPALVEEGLLTEDRPFHDRLAPAMRATLTVYAAEERRKDAVMAEEAAAPGNPATHETAPDAASADAAPRRSDAGTDYGDNEEGGEDAEVPPTSRAPHATAVSGLPGALPDKAPDDFWIVAPGRGRRDKGWNRLHRIAAILELYDPSRTLRLVTQRPRAMDKLDLEVGRIEECANVILLDEIISGEDLGRVMSRADAFLLPYDRQVYGVRGSAFVWDAVCNCKPMLVSADTALEEAIVHGNGISCSDDMSFVTAIARLRDDYPLFRERAEAAFLDYLSHATNNPIVRACRRQHYFHASGVLAISPKPLHEALEIAELRPGEKMIRLAVSGTGPVRLALPHYPVPGQGDHFVGYDALVNPATGEVRLPAEVIEALRGGFLRKVVIDRTLRGVYPLRARLEEIGVSKGLVTLF